MQESRKGTNEERRENEADKADGKEETEKKIGKRNKLQSIYNVLSYSYTLNNRLRCYYTSI